MSGFYITVNGLPASFYTNQWFLDNDDAWTIDQLIANICGTVGCGGSHQLKKNGNVLDTASTVLSELQAGDTVDFVEV